MGHQLHERYPALVTTPRLARGHVAAYLTATGRTDLIASATLLVSELVTNAVIHAGGTIDLRVAITDDTLRIDVHDTSDARPHLRQPDGGGRGLHIVDAIATNWGVTTDGNGKTTWFELALT
jgi:anti-sigma regulatory factor (Ser/Thr protein kinase)